MLGEGLSPQTDPPSIGYNRVLKIKKLIKYTLVYTLMKATSNTDPPLSTTCQLWRVLNFFGSGFGREQSRGHTRTRPRPSRHFGVRSGGQQIGKVANE